MPREPLEYKHQYHDLLWQQVGDRVEGVRSGRIPREEMTVPDAEACCSVLRESGLELYLASGTDLKYVRDELQVLGLEEYFGPHVYGAFDDYQKFSKAMVIARIIADTGVQGHEIIGMGDGFVEIEEVKSVGGLAVGVASNEETRTGVNDWKRNRLIRAGADLIIGDYRCRAELLRLAGIAAERDADVLRVSSRKSMVRSYVPGRRSRRVAREHLAGHAALLPAAGCGRRGGRGMVRFRLLRRRRIARGAARAPWRVCST